jgi:hypothetical protein
MRQSHKTYYFDGLNISRPDSLPVKEELRIEDISRLRDPPVILILFNSIL